jgi:hypothetical protein
MSAERLVFIDETWASTNMARRHGRAQRGQRVVAAVPHGHVWTPPSVQEESLNKALRVIGCCHVSGL